MRGLRVVGNGLLGRHARVRRLFPGGFALLGAIPPRLTECGFFGVRVRHCGDAFGVGLQNARLHHGLWAGERARHGPAFSEAGNPDAKKRQG